MDTGPRESASLTTYAEFADEKSGHSEIAPVVLLKMALAKEAEAALREEAEACVIEVDDIHGTARENGPFRRVF